MYTDFSTGDHAPSGVAMTPALRWGSHLGHFFDTPDDIEKVLVPYFRAGLENNERCLWVAGAPFGAEQARRAMRLAMPGFDARERSGQIEIVDGEAFYEANASLAPEELVAGLLKREEDAVASGFKGLRTNGNCSWVGHGEWDAFGRYETIVDQSVRGRRMICMCSYHAERLEARQMIDVVSRHDLMLHRNDAKVLAADAAGPDAALAVDATTQRHDFQDDLDAVGAIAAVPILLKIICQVTGLGFSAVARVTRERWVCLAVHDEIAFGLLPGGELAVETTLCHEIWQSHDAIVINHVAEDAIYRLHHTPATYGFQSYISVPIVLQDGRFYGTLCAIDPNPAELRTPEITGMFRAFADLLAFHLDAGSRLASAEASLLDARAAAKLHDQFVAVLGHDLRNPIAAISAGVRLLGKQPSPEKADAIVGGIGKSAERMSTLVDDIIDLARGQLGVELALRRSRDGLAPALRHVIEEIRLAHPGRAIEAELDICRPVEADAAHLARLLSNLVSNALKYGAADTAIRISAVTGEQFVLTVSNEGEPIRPAIRERLFAPFTRGDVRPEQQGLGLGLYIVSEIARAHGGTVEVRSDKTETCFTFRMALGSPD